LELQVVQSKAGKGINHE